MKRTLRLLMLLAAWPAFAQFPPAPVATAVLTLSKTDSADPVLPGQQYAYALQVANEGAAIATNVLVSDHLPGGVTFVSAATPVGTASLAGTNVTFSYTTLAVGQIVTATVVVQAATSGLITNTATASATNTSDVASQTTYILSDLRVAVADSADPAVLDQLFTYTLAVSNASASAITNVVLTDTLPGHVEFVSATGSVSTVSNVGSVVTLQVASLGAGATATATIQVLAVSGGVRTNQAYATGQSGALVLLGLGAESTRILGAVSDLSGDGLGDLLLRAESNSVFFLQAMSGTNAAGGAYLFQTNDVGNWQFAASSDLNGDGTADLIFRDGSVHAVAYVNDGQATNLAYLFRTRADLDPWYAVAGGDLDADGYGDLVFQRGDSGLYAVVLQRSNTWLAVQYLTGTRRDLDPWRVVGAGDTDADGLWDLVVQRADSGVYGLVFMQGWNVREAWYLSGARTNVSPWVFRAASDLDGDGFDELIFQDGVSNQYEATFVDGYSVLLSSPLFSGSGGLSGWTIVGPK